MTRSAIRATAILAVALAGALVLAACSSPENGQPSDRQPTQAVTTVVEENNQFQPPQVTVKPGDTVVFENRDGVAHEVEIGGTSLGRQQPDEKVSLKAGKTGTYPYRCLIHPSMTGTIRVQ